MTYYSQGQDDSPGHEPVQTPKTSLRKPLGESLSHRLESNIEFKAYESKPGRKYDRNKVAFTTKDISPKTLTYSHPQTSIEDKSISSVITAPSTRRNRGLDVELVDELHFLQTATKAAYEKEDDSLLTDDLPTSRPTTLNTEGPATTTQIPSLTKTKPRSKIYDAESRRQYE